MIKKSGKKDSESLVSHDGGCQTVNIHVDVAIDGGSASLSRLPAWALVLLVTLLFAVIVVVVVIVNPAAAQPLGELLRGLLRP